MFLDLNVVWPTNQLEQSELRNTLRLLKQFNYNGVAINNIVNTKAANSKNPIQIINMDLTTISKDKSSKSQQSTSEIITLLSQPRILSNHQFHQYTRITVLLEDSDNSNFSLDAAQKNYDIIALRPTSEKTFQAACSRADVDIISLDFSTRLPFYLRHQTLGLAIQRGVFFEI
ncbi:hypothetical protein HK096_004672, partial [Nowakowskiella sp. JEL0078]